MESNLKTSNLIKNTNYTSNGIYGHHNHQTNPHSRTNGVKSSSIDQCDMTSLEILNKCHLDLFPKKKTICDDVECMRIVDQLPILNGEYIHFIGKICAIFIFSAPKISLSMWEFAAHVLGPSGKQNEEILLATNFRIFLLMHESVSFINVPIMLVESIEVKEILFVYVYLKNAKTLR